MKQENRPSAQQSNCEVYWLITVREYDRWSGMDALRTNCYVELYQIVSYLSRRDAVILRGDFALAIPDSLTVSPQPRRPPTMHLV